MLPPVSPYDGDPPTGEPDAGDPPVRFGGRGSVRSPYPYIERHSPFVLRFFVSPVKDQWLSFDRTLEKLHARCLRHIHLPLAWQNHAMPTSEELLELANRCASKLELDGKLRHVPSFSDAEEQCDNEYENLLQAIHEDELFAPVDIQRQEQLVEQIAAALPDDKRTLIVELADNHARHVWLQQEGAYHVGLAVGHRLRLKT